MNQHGHLTPQQIQRTTVERHNMYQSIDGMSLENLRLKIEGGKERLNGDLDRRDREMLEKMVAACEAKIKETERC